VCAIPLSLRHNFSRRGPSSYNDLVDANAEGLYLLGRNYAPLLSGGFRCCPHSNFEFEVANEEFQPLFRFGK
jgi:hypothetical protein